MSRAFRFTLNAALFWIVASTFWYSCILKQVCLPDPPADGISLFPPLPAMPASGTAAPRLPAVPASDKALSFAWNAAEPLRGPGFEKFRSDLLRQQPKDAALEITGIQFAGERNPDLALARATRVKELFVDRVPSDRILIVARLADRASAEQRSQFEAVAIRWATAADANLPPPPAPPPSTAAPPPIAGAPATAAGNRILVYFPTAAGTQTLDPEMLAQLRSLAAAAARDGQTVVVTGHTDNRGDEAANIALGLTRATTIRDYLAATVSPPPQMRVESEGPRQPLASNDSAEGRARNRRVEVSIR